MRSTHVHAHHASQAFTDMATKLNMPITSMSGNTALMKQVGGRGRTYC